MDHVAPEPEKWDIDSVKMSLYTNFFPPDMKARLRRELKHAKQQPTEKFADYLRRLKRLQRRIGDIDDKGICLKLWDTVHRYLKIKWIEADVDPEDGNLELMTDLARRFEAAEEVRRGVRIEADYVRVVQPAPARNEGRASHAHGQQVPPRTPSRRQSTPAGPPRPQARSTAQTHTSSQPGSSKPQNRGSNSKPKPKLNRSKLSKEEKDELRAANKCYECKETGHVAKDCPTHNTAKPSTYTAALRPDFATIEKLRKQRELASISIASIQLTGTNEDETNTDTESESSFESASFEEITPYSKIVEVTNDRLKITSEDSDIIEMSYVEIARQTLPTIPEETTSALTEEEWEYPEWSESDDETQRPTAGPSSSSIQPESSQHNNATDPTAQLNVLRVGDKKHGDSSTKVIERNASKPKDLTRKLPKPIIVKAMINGKEVRALVDSGSLGDFMSTTVVDQLRLKREKLAKPIGLQMAVTGSRSSINHSVVGRFGYQGIDEDRRFDVINLENYDLILGTPFMYQYKVIMGFNPPTISLGCTKAEPIDRETALIIELMAAELYEEKIEERREELRQYGADLCKNMSETPLPPFRAINHTIPLIDENKKYRSRRVQCPKPLEPLFNKKFAAYLETKRWEYQVGTNAIPMLIMMKKSKDGKIAVRTVLDKREINANTHKLASPLPDINDILLEVSKHKYRSLIDGKDAYEQIRVVPEHVHRTLFMTPKGTMVSQVMQQGDCNAGATYQALMNHVFAAFIGKFMFVYLDDIIIFSDTVEEHERHVKMVFDVLRKEKLYLSPSKMQLFADRLEILGHVITDEGIMMDPHKVDAVEKWKVPANKDQLASFLGAVGYLAPNCKDIRIAMAPLSKRASMNQPWRWEATEQRAFDETKRIVSEYRNSKRGALDYSPNAPPINLTTDACCTGASGVVSQGEDLATAKITAFWSGKFTATQQNYPVHEQELLAIKESLERFKHLLHGARIRVFTDHKALEHFSTQDKLSPRQTRWMEKINEFDIEVHYIPGETNVLADALSRMYSDEPNGVVRHKSEYVSDTDQEAPHIMVSTVRRTNGTREELTEPLYVGDGIRAELEKRLGTGEAPRRSSRDRKLVERYQNQPQRKRRTARPTESDKIEPALENKTETSETKEDWSVVVQPDESREIRQEPEKSANRASALTNCVTEFELPNGLKGRYQEDESLAYIAKNPDQYRNFELKDDILYMRQDDDLLLCIPDIKVGERSVREIVITHAHSILAHLGTRKTLSWLRTQVWWKTMVKDVRDYCESCHTCAVSKTSTQKPLGLLQAMPVPSYLWQSIGVDFVGPLPESETRYGKFDMITTVIDNLSRMVHLIPTKQEYTARDVAEIVFEHVYKLHGMPEKIISDRDSLFTSTFWEKLSELTKIELKRSSAYHPQTDGMTERVQRTYSGLLRTCAGRMQKDWAKHLPAIEFAINSARSEATGLSPFYLNYGRTPSLMVHDTNSKFPGVREHIERIKMAIMAGHDAVIDARAKMTRQANTHRRPAEIKEGNLVYVSTKNMRIPKGQARKLAPKYVGPYKVLRVLTRGASYEIELPKEIKARGIHPVFHASLLRVHVPSDDRRFPGREFNQIVGLGDAPQEWAVERVLTHKGKGRKAIFKLAWKTGDETWEPYRAVRHLEALKAYCEAQGVSEVGKLEANVTDEIEGSEPEDYELNFISVCCDYKTGGKTHGKNPPTPPNYYFTPLVPIYHSIPYATEPMSGPQASTGLTWESLQVILAGQNQVQMASQDNAAKSQDKAMAVLKDVTDGLLEIAKMSAQSREESRASRYQKGRKDGQKGWKPGQKGKQDGKGKTKRQRDRIRKDAEAAAADPGSQNTLQSGSGGSGGVSHGEDLLADWPDFDPTAHIPMTEQHLVVNHTEPGNDAHVPVAAPSTLYTAQTTAIHIAPTQPTQVADPVEAQVTNNTTTPTQNNAGGHTGQSQPSEAQSTSEEQEVDYEMDDSN
ncbi:Reverse transcriptase (RNA-dependent DNA polymerase) [Ceratobasidium sp. AG-Ba]|nr:Reverse transcriptase (RNA-dependent DNA polymerase) [Ceratobasidium sp. AG-Ba]